MKIDYLSMLEKERSDAQEAISRIHRLSDVDFVAYIRQISEEGPSWTNLVLWDKEVRHELDSRLLLRLSEFLNK